MDHSPLTEHVMQRRIPAYRRRPPRLSPWQVAIAATALMLAMDAALAAMHPRAGWAWAIDLAATCVWVTACLRVAVRGGRDDHTR